MSTFALIVAVRAPLFVFLSFAPRTMHARSVQFGSSFSSSFPIAVSTVGKTSRSRSLRGIPIQAKTTLEFIRGIEETTVPDVRLTRSQKGNNGTAMFRFDKPSVLETDAEVGDVTGLYMVDEEGVIRTVDVSAKFVNGNLEAIEARYTMNSLGEWDRFMRFMERYASENGLGFEKVKILN